MASQPRPTDPVRSWQFILHGGSSETCPDAAHQNEIIQRLDSLARVLTKALAEGSAANDAVHLALSAEQGMDIIAPGLGTMGAIVLDRQGHLATGSSTNQEKDKTDTQPDDALSADLYADSRLAVLCGGSGDQGLNRSVAANAAKCYVSSSNVADAARRALDGVSATGASYALTIMDSQGNAAVESTARLSYIATASSSEAPVACILPNTCPILASHEFYNDEQLRIGHSRYPTMTGHALVTVKSSTDLFSLPVKSFVRALTTISKAASLLRRHYKVGRCALITEGGNSLSILPLHGLSKGWKPIISNKKKFHETYPGYISSIDGPTMANSKLDTICLKIQEVSSLSAPFNYRFCGAQDNMNLFARIVRGELQQWRVWEDDRHVAFLTPFANTPGFTVLVPREHLSSDIFSIDREPFEELMAAAHRVGEVLKQALGTTRCGMIFEGFEINYAHVKLIPIHSSAKNILSSGFSIKKMAPFQETYQGYVTSLEGPRLEDFESPQRATLDIRNMYC